MNSIPWLNPVSWSLGDVAAAVTSSGVVLAATYALARTLIHYIARTVFKAYSPDKITARFVDGDTIRRNLKHFVEPYAIPGSPPTEDSAQRNTTAEHATSRSDKSHTKANRKSVFSILDSFMSKKSKSKFLILLGDSGSGKTTALLGFYARTRARIRRPFDPPVFLDLRQGPERLFSEIDKLASLDRAPSINILVDGLDEFPGTHDELAKFIKDLLHRCDAFRRAVFSCRSQYLTPSFVDDLQQLLPARGALPMGQPAWSTVQQATLLPLTNLQSLRYLLRRFGFRPHLAFRVLNFCREVDDVSARPLILDFVSNLLSQKKGDPTLSPLSARYGLPVNLFDIYCRIVDAWLIREERWIDRSDLWELTLHSARAINTERLAGRPEIITRTAVSEIIAQHDIDTTELKASGRSLLTVAQNDDMRFAHRSLYEFIVVGLALLDEDAAQSSLDSIHTVRQKIISRGKSSHEHIASLVASGSVMTFRTRKSTDVRPWTDMMKHFILSEVCGERSMLRVFSSLGRSENRLEGDVALASLYLHDIDISNAQIRKSISRYYSRTSVSESRMSGCLIKDSISLKDVRVNGTDCSGVTIQGRARQIGAPGTVMPQERPISISDATFILCDLSKLHLDRCIIKRMRFEFCDFSNCEIGEEVSISDCSFLGCSNLPKHFEQYIQPMPTD